ncbi:hypothetical protein FORC066_1007 [Yersinia enterocolitica]|nr:hypothetical protein FORC066_1007 [Yersinia enterocolitica]
MVDALQLLSSNSENIVVKSEKISVIFFEINRIESEQYKI